MSLFGKGGTVRSRSNGRAIMLIGVVLAVLVWGGMAGPLSNAVWRIDTTLQDRLSLILEPGTERDDLVFLGINESWRKELDQAGTAGLRALQLMSEEVGNHQLDRRVYAELIEKLAAAGAKVIVFDILFVGSSGNPQADREFAEALYRHRDKVVLSMMLRPSGDGFYEPVSSVRQLPLLSHKPGEVPHEGYVNLWPDAEDEVVRRMIYTTSLGELQSGEGVLSERVFESLATVTARVLGADVPEGRSPRLRFAVSAGGESSYAAAYAPRSLHTVFVPDQWKDDYADGAFFRDKVVLISTSTKADGDYHRIPGATIFGGQFHLQALGSWLDESYWERAPQWVDMVALLAMAALAVLIGIALRNPLAIFFCALALAGGFVVVCGWISSLSGVLFAGTPGLLGLGLVTLCAEIGQFVARRGTEGSPRPDGPRSKVREESEKLQPSN